MNDTVYFFIQNTFITVFYTKFNVLILYLIQCADTIQHSALLFSIPYCIFGSRLNRLITYWYLISTHLSTFQPQKWDFAKHAQPQPKKVRAYKKKVYHLSLYLKACLITWYSNNWFKQKRCIYYVTVTCYSTTDFKTPFYDARTCLMLPFFFEKN